MVWEFIFQYEFTLKNCFHHKTEDIAIRITMGFVNFFNYIYILYNKKKIILCMFWTLTSNFFLLYMAGY